MFKLVGGESSCAKPVRVIAASSCSRKSRTFFTVEMDIHLMKLCVEHNPYQLGKNQWDFILTDMKETFNADFLLRTLKERTNKLIEKYSGEQLTYKTGTEEQLSELGSLLEQVVGYIDASSVPINQQTSTDALHSGDDEEPYEVVTPISHTKTARQKEKVLADMERDELLHETDVAPEPRTGRRRRSSLLPEDQLILKKQEQDYELDLKRLKMEERKLECEFEIQQQKNQLERERLIIEKEKNRILDEDRKRQDTQQNIQMEIMKQMHELVTILVKK